MGILKLALYGTIAYLGYRFYQDVTRPTERTRQPQSKHVESPITARAAALDGPVEGVPVRTQDPTGATMTHRVGRGVVRR